MLTLCRAEEHNLVALREQKQLHLHLLNFVNSRALRCGLLIVNHRRFIVCMSQGRVHVLNSNS